MSQASFFTESEQHLAQRFLEHGYVIVDVDDRDELDRIQSHAAQLAAAYLQHTAPPDPRTYLDQIHRHVTAQTLNGLRLHVINGLNGEPWMRPSYFAVARRALETLVGNELAMQRRVNLSIQLPQDSSSLLPIHADVWDGDSPYEVVVWIPLVDCYDTKAMYLVSPSGQDNLDDTFKGLSNKSAEDLYQAFKDKAHFIPVRYGQVMIFSQTLMHGNRVNQIDETRWSMNVRFKSALSPYADKRLGEFFEPITLRAATQVGLNYRPIKGFEDD